MHYPFNCRLSAPTYTPAFVRFNIFHFPRSLVCNTLSELFITRLSGILHFYYSFSFFLFLKNIYIYRMNFLGQIYLELLKREL